MKPWFLDALYMEIPTCGFSERETDSQISLVPTMETLAVVRLFSSQLESSLRSLNRLIHRHREVIGN